MAGTQKGRKMLARGFAIALIGGICVWWAIPVEQVGPSIGNETRGDRGADATLTDRTNPTVKGGARAEATARAEEKRPGGKVHGKVVDESGTPLPGMVITLEDGLGEPIDEAVTGVDGRYEVRDPDLTGAALSYSDEEGDKDWPIGKLAPGETRELDIVIGEVREVVGWVLDLQGEPQTGVLVTMVAEKGGSQWRTATDLGGGFRFANAPATPVRLTADGGELGQSSARLAGSPQKRRDVTLVLEPTATLVVYANPKIRGRVIVRSWSEGIHGSDGVWTEYIGPESSGETTGREEEQQAEELAHVETTLGNALMSYDAEDPEGGLTRIILDLMPIAPMELQPMLVTTNYELYDEGAGTPETRARELAKRFLAEEPRMTEVLKLAAENIRTGMSPFQAIEASEAAVPASEPMEETVPVGDELGDMTASDEGDVMTLEPMTIEGDPLAFDPSEFSGESGGMAFWELTEKMKADLGVTQISFAGAESAVVAKGAIGEEIALRASFTFEVAIALDDPGPPGELEINCGQVFARPGERLEISCGGVGETELIGRVVDVEGRPLSGVKVETWESDAPVNTLTDVEGRYALRVRLELARTCELEVSDERGSLVTAQVRNVSCIPGMKTEVRDVTMRRPEEAPERNIARPFGGVGASLALSGDGVVFQEVREDGPLAFEGVEDGTTVIAVDEEDASTWSLDDMLAILRGEVGTEVGLRLRSREGELYEVMIERGLIRPESGMETEEITR